jgi:hypothetical protein
MGLFPRSMLYHAARGLSKRPENAMIAAVVDLACRSHPRADRVFASFPQSPAAVVDDPQFFIIIRERTQEAS